MRRDRQADRAVDAVVAAAKRTDAEAEISEIDAVRLDPGGLAELTGASLFSSLKVAVVRDLAQLPADLVDDVTRLAASPGDDLALVLVHGGGQKGKGLLDKLKKSKVQVVDCQAIKAWELPQFVAAEAKRARGTIDKDAAQFLADEAKRGRKKPTVGFIAGRTAPPGRRMGHAGAIISGGKGDAESKIAAMEAAGIRVSPSPARLGKTLVDVLKG